MESRSTASSSVHW
ncbi:unnamed protein product [Linum tenue]|uniref:Uncharacterized protein n=1 Tax=Linum tenue TaxID=586396 RepID=A0AAV0H1D4_9ROSI|nr:unnamed protein product [Linum tenue]